MMMMMMSFVVVDHYHFAIIGHLVESILRDQHEENRRNLDNHIDTIQWVSRKNSQTVLLARAVVYYWSTTVLYSTFLLYVIYLLYLFLANTFSWNRHTLSALYPVTILAHGHDVHFVVAIHALLGISLVWHHPYYLWPRLLAIASCPFFFSVVPSSGSSRKALVTTRWQ